MAPPLRTEVQFRERMAPSLQSVKVTMITASRTPFRIDLLAALLVAAALPGCETAIGPAQLDPLSDGYDLCAVSDWYGDGECDAGCAEPDPDCMPEECDEACADVCDAAWTGAAAPAVPDGCSADPVACDCGDAPVECPDVCEAECTGQPVPAVPEGCPVMDACDCADVLAAGDDPAPQSLTLPGSLSDTPCATADPADAEVSSVAGTEACLTAEAISRARRRRAVSLVMHVLRAPPINQYNYDKPGDVSRRLLVKQLRVLNRAYAHTSFKFKLTMITRTTSSKWFYANQDSREEAALKGKLHRGGPATLNVYTFYGGIGSWATFPWWVTAHPKSDGVMLSYRELPGGEVDAYNKGHILIHEVGHWLGLYHTFMFGCSKNRSDGLADTAAEASPAYGCKVGRDSCPGQRGADPIHNYMDYSNDSCTNQFTAGQRSRMKTMALGWRDLHARASVIAGSGGCGDGVCDGDEIDATCAADCGCSAAACVGIAPIGCYCDATCADTGDCCADADTCR